MSRHLRSGGVLLLVALGLSLSGCRDSAPATPPNILFVMTDDHASHAISAYGSVINRTPHIDRLASEGMLFRNAFVANSICAPSRAAILTGQYGHLNGVMTNRERFDSTRVTFPQLLQEAGYQTAIVGKWHLKSPPVGFDHWEVLPGQGTYYNPVFRTADGPVDHTGYVTDLITDKLLDWLRSERDPGRPFLLMFQHKAPHRAWEPGPDYLTMYDERPISEPETLFDDYSGRTSAAAEQEMTVERHLFDRDLKLIPPPNLNEDQLAAWNAAYDPKNDAFAEAGLEGDDRVRWIYQRYIKDYLRTIASVDDNVGRVLQYLDESGLADNTVVIYTSDQGFYLGDHGWYDKRWMYEESLRTPLIVRWPSVIEPGSETGQLVQNLDLGPTMLNLAGVDVPEWMQGRSLVPLLSGPPPGEWRDAIYYQYFEYPAVHMVRRHRGVRTHRYKLIHFYEVDEWELFDLEEDPRELRSVYGDTAYSDVQAALKTRLAELMVQYAVPEDDPVPYPDG